MIKPFLATVTEASLQCWLTKSPECIMRIRELDFEIPPGTLPDRGTMKLCDFLYEAAEELTQAQEICPAAMYEQIKIVSEKLQEMAMGDLQFHLEFIDPTGETVLESPEAITHYDASPNLYLLAEKLESGKIKNIIVLSGAGLSCSAGIPDFRSPGTGLYDRLCHLNLPQPECVFDLSYFRSNPTPFWTVANEIWPINKTYHPTVGHRFIKELQDKGLLLRNYTQNIDGLERAAGINSDFLVECHGTFTSAGCIDCGKKVDVEVLHENVRNATIPKCSQCTGLVKPDIVFFGESLPTRFQEMLALDLPKCDLLIIAGTSLKVEPFCSLINRVPETCSRVLINRDLVGVKNQECTFQFTDPILKRDVFLQGDCDTGFETLKRVFFNK